MLQVRYLLAPALLAVTTACGPTSVNGYRSPEDAYSQLHGESGINSGKSYEQIIADFKAFADKHKDLCEMFEFGSTVEGRKLTGMRIQDKTVQVSGKRPAVLISEGIHGNEYLNITDRLPEQFIEGTPSTGGFKKLLAKGGVVFVVPIFNPDGYTARQRENGHNQDLNRDYTIKAAGNRGFTQPETKGITDYIASQVQQFNLSLEASMEYHCCIGGLIHPWNYDVNRSLDAEQAKRMREEIGLKLVKEDKYFKDYLIGNVREVVNYPNGAVGGSDDYYLETYGRRAFSFEGAEGSEFRNLSRHVAMWDLIFERAGDGFQDGTGGGTTTPPPTGGTTTPPTGGTTTPPTGGAATGDFYLAIESENTAGVVQLAVSVPDTYDGAELCLGTKDQCAAGSATQRVQATVAGTKDGRKILKVANPMQVPDNGTILTVNGTKGGQLAAQRQIKISKR